MQEVKQFMRIWNGYQHGINFGGWLSQKKQTERHLSTFITESDFATVASWGLDHVRIPVDYELVETEGSIRKEEGFLWITRCLEWCQKYHLNMILDLHKTAGYVFDDQNGSREFFSNFAYQARFISLWQEFARRFGQYHEMLAFELLNEIVDPAVSDQWNTLVARTIESIRSVAPEIKILVGGIHHNAPSGIALLDPPADENIVYNIHCYEPIIFTHQTASWTKGMRPDFHIAYPDSIDLYRRSAAAFSKEYTESLVKEGVTDVEESLFEAVLKEAIEKAEKYNVPLYCGEYGVIDQADLESTLRWYQVITKVFDRHNIGHAAWTYREMDFGLTDSHMAPVVSQIIPIL
jgi:aryl-phospho-beta-D-glucosidase BglC (GH1 family)